MTDPAAAPLDPKVLDALKAMSQNQPQFILTTKSYFNQHGLRIEENILVDGAFPEGFPRFVAHAVARITVPWPKGYQPAPGEQQPVKRQPLDPIPLPAENIQEAYAVAGPLLQAAAEQVQKQFEEQMNDPAAQEAMRKMLNKDRKR